MPACKECGEDVEELFNVKVGSKRRLVCEDCAELLEEQELIGEEQEAVIQQMMGYKGRR
jgi:hypothetical protein